MNVRDIGKELGVAYVIEGSVQKGGNRLRITVQLVETENGAHVWSSRYDGTVDDIFDLQDRITEQLAGAIQPSIRIAEIERSRANVRRISELRLHHAGDAPCVGAREGRSRQGARSAGKGAGG